MKEVARRESVESLCPQGKLQSTKNIPVYTEGVHVAMTLGLFGGLFAPMVVALTSGIVTPLEFTHWMPLVVPGGGTLGALLAGGTVAALTAKHRIHKELTGSNEFTVDNRSIFQMLSLKKKNTVLDLGKDADGKAIKAIVRSSLKGLTVEYLSMPSPLETWDKTAQTLIEVHGLTPKVSQKALAS